MTPDPEEVEKAIEWAKNGQTICQCGGASRVDARARILVCAYLSQEADFQARLAPWVDAVLAIRDKWIPALRRDAREPDKTLCNAGSIAFLVAHVAPLCGSSPDALRAQAREAEIRAEALRKAGDWFKAWKDMPASYERAGEALHRMADEAERAKAKAAAKPKEGA